MKTTKVCHYLRTKAMYIPALAEDPRDPQEISRASHCWCNCTLSETGPDDRPVGYQVCTPERSCYEQ